VTPERTLDRPSNTPHHASREPASPTPTSSRRAAPAA
jgi:hypothetical protein